MTFQTIVESSVAQTFRVSPETGTSFHTSASLLRGFIRVFTKCDEGSLNHHSVQSGTLTSCVSVCQVFIKRGLQTTRSADARLYANRHKFHLFVVVMVVNNTICSPWLGSGHEQMMELSRSYFQAQMTPADVRGEPVPLPRLTKHLAVM